MQTSKLVTAGVAIAILIGIGAVLLAVYRDTGPKADTTLSLSQVVLARENPAYEPDPSRVRFAVAPVLSPRATLENYDALATYLGERLEKSGELVQGKSYAEINALVRSGEVTLALVCSGAFVVAQREFGMQALVVPVINGEKTYRSYLIVPSGSATRGWEDLRHKVFAFTDPLSNTGRLVPLYVLSQMGETPDKFFQNFIFTYSHDNSVRAVAEGLVDGASVDSLVYNFMLAQDPSLVTRTNVVWTSPPYGINPVVVHPSMPLETRQQLEDIFLNMSTDPKGQEVLRHLGVDAFVRPDPSAYDTIEAMMLATGVR